MRGQVDPFFVGGIAVSLVVEEFVQAPRVADFRFITFLPDQPSAAVSRQLATDDGDSGADDTGAMPTDSSSRTTA